MATDATGTPTALGIPKYDTSVDAPSGLGFNAAMDVIDTLISTAGKTTVKHAGTTVGTRTAINLIDGTNVTLTVADNAGADRVDVTVASSVGPTDPTMGGDLSGTASNAQIVANAVGATELADNAVDTNAIQDNAVTFAKQAKKVQGGASSITTDGSGQVVITFPTAFPTSCDGVVATTSDPGSGAPWTAQITAKSTTTFTVLVRSGGTTFQGPVASQAMTINWVAVGT